jgi:4-hydroxybenzoate polyprenyltransferase
LQGAYTGVLKNIAILDVFAIALLFVIRAAVGAAAVDVEISTWLLLCTGLLALLLALAKRRAELVLVDEGQAAGRRSLYGYSVAYVDQCLTLVGAATVIAYSLYSIEAAVAGMAITIPFVAYGVLRYLMLVHLRGWGEEPDRILIKDRPLQLAIIVWVLVAAAVLVEAG